MEVMTTISRRPGLTRASLAETPDDGYRYELIDGALFVTPAPGFRHQRVVVTLWAHLERACPPDLVVMVAPFAVGLAEDTEVQPDVLVAAKSAFTDKDLPAAPLLAVEVLSKSTRRTDLDLKWERFQRAGVASYWVIDPQGPSLVAWELTDGAFVEVARVEPAETWQATRPFPVAISPGVLI